MVLNFHGSLEETKKRREVIFREWEVKLEWNRGGKWEEMVVKLRTNWGWSKNLYYLWKVFWFYWSWDLHFLIYMVECGELSNN